jgi:hypothetical protein
MTKVQCIIGQYCSVHGIIHGYEAEELRKRIESYVEMLLSNSTESDLVDSQNVAEDLQGILGDVDARDSVAYLEASANDEQVFRTCRRDLEAQAALILEQEGWLVGRQAHESGSSRMTAFNDRIVAWRRELQEFRANHPSEWPEPPDNS